MLHRYIAPVVFCLKGCLAFGESFQLNTGPDMVPLSEAVAKEILLPETVANFTEWIGSNKEFASFGLHPRQRQCVDAGYYPCSNGIRCCPQGSTCVAGGCCQGDAQQCGSSKCYVPSTQICCKSGVACLKGQNCVDGGCCDSGEEKCGTSGCYNPKTSVCCGGEGRNCPKGTDCMPGGGCCPSGQKRCGQGRCYDPRTMTCCTGSGTAWACPKDANCCSTGYCAKPSTQRCCKNGSCLKETTCCEKECCKSIGYCASDGYCKACPAATRSITSTDTITTTSIKTVRVTSDIEPDTGNAPEFTCVPMTATNDGGAILELDEGCTLHYEPPEATATDDTAARIRRDVETSPTNRGRELELLARQASCTPYTTFTRTVWETETSTETGTRTVIVQGEDGTFSCPEMEVTNDVGDVLALDAECALSFTPAEPTTTAEGDDVTASRVPSATAAASSAGGSQGDSAASIDGVCRTLVVGIVGAAIFWTNV
ncbi:hypothetical protein FGRMN_4186 [Fusarium graminum]|nr:hypothetical protein FGRMN_4186 [Fusarium graminum]